MTFRALPIAVLAVLAASQPTFGEDLIEEAHARPILVELFTSQGCGACPAANAYLETLNERDGVIAISYPVTYWNPLGWRDTLAQDAFNARQSSYIGRLDGMRRKYTPQLIVDGQAHAPGNKAAKVEAMLSARAETVRPEAPLSLALDGDTLVVSLGADPAVEADHQIMVAAVSPGPHPVDVTSGENKGKVVAHVNVVKSIASLGDWSGEPVRYTITPEDDRAYAVFVQHAETAEVAAVRYWAPAPATL